MKKKLWLAFGPVIVAFLLVGGFFLLPTKGHIENNDFLKEAATSLDAKVFKGNIVKKTAIKKGYVPIFGSSELSRFSPFHPSVLQEKYQKTPPFFLLGAAGTQSLPHFFAMNNLPLENKKAIMIISPQWFVAGGIKKDYFNFYFSPLQVQNWLLNLKTVTEKDQYVAQRLLTFGLVKDSFLLKKALEEVKAGQLPKGLLKQSLNINYRFLEKEDGLFSAGILEKKNQSLIHKKIKELPPKYNPIALQDLALEKGATETKGNPFKIKDHFYQKKILPQLAELKEGQRSFDYRYSPEFSDFQLVLATLAKKQTDALFIIPPVNKRWSDYTGLSQEMLREFATKIKYQLQSQGFNHILDLNDKSDLDYYLEDTIHLGWRGWLDVETGINEFLQAKTTPTYQMKSNFYSKEWQNLDPKKINTLN